MKFNNINELIGKRIAAAREDLDLSGAQFGANMARYLGEPWTRQTIWQAEKGQRAFRVDELFALAQATGRPVQYFVTAQAGEIVGLQDFNKQRAVKHAELATLVGAAQPTKQTAIYIDKAVRLLGEIDADNAGQRGRIKALDAFLRAVSRDAKS